MSGEVWAKALEQRAVMVAKTAQGDFYRVGRVIAYCEQPTVVLELADGTHKSWRADMVRSADPEEVLALAHMAMDNNRDNQ